MRAPRRTALLCLPVLTALASCGIPTTGVVEAGRPAGGVEPRVRIYLVRDGALFDVPRRTALPIDVESAVDALLQGPTDDERAQRVTTFLPLTGLPPTHTAAPAPLPSMDVSSLSTPVPGTSAQERDLVRVRTTADRVTIELNKFAGPLNDLAAAQLICTALAAQRVADPTAAPKPVTVEDSAGRGVEATEVDCPPG
ncbi:hypothetical protein [Streptomyces sp. NPDC002328]|uniref:hypothetical protein n=1 Tax=Streptomyces sp. NPDC002328 TaxID=3364642 RepID=UPI00367F7E5E